VVVCFSQKKKKKSRNAGSIKYLIIV